MWRDILKKNWIWGIYGLLVISSCEVPQTEDRLLARVHNISLYLSELDGMFPEKTNGKDSTLIINAYVERWVKDAILLYEAEKNAPQDLNIDELVRDYRASLLKHNYEKTLVERQLDSTISQMQLDNFYEKNKEQYQLETPIVRCRFIKIPTNAPDRKWVRKWWNSNNEEDYTNLLTYCSQYAVSHILADTIWYRLEKVAEMLPKGTISEKRISSKLDLSQADSDYQYFLKILDVRKQKEIAPLSFIENQARKVILHRRKIRLLEETKESMYQIALRRNDIQLFID